MEVATTMKIMKITHAVATTIIIQMVEAKVGEDTTIKAKVEEDTTIKVITTNSKAANKNILISIVNLLGMEI